MDIQQIWFSIVDYMNANGWNIVIFLAVLVVGVIVVRALCYGLRKLLMRSRIETSLVGFIVTVCRFVLYLVLVFVLAAVLGVDMTPFASMLSAALVAVGLALQSSLSNIANGVILISTHPFREGDYVDIGSKSGTVKSIGMFVTELITPDNKKVVLTNSNVIGSDIVNYSERPTRRVDMIFAVPHGTDVEKAKAVILGVLEAHPLVLDEPAPNVRLHEITDSRLNVIARPWVKNEDYWDVYWDVTERVLVALIENGIEVPGQKLDVRVKKED